MVAYNSSLSNISGDVPQPSLKRTIYRMNAGLERLYARAGHLSDRFTVLDFDPVIDQSKIIETFGSKAQDASPTRVLCYSYLLEFAKEKLEPECEIVDLGCGFGHYSQHLKKLLDYTAYLGFDIERRDAWKGYENERAVFRTAELGKEKIDIGHARNIFSQSVLEHVHHDCRIFDLFGCDAPVTLKHLHLVPAPMSYFETRYHGFRRYGIRELTRLLSHPGFQNITITPLGNAVSREFHALQHGKRSAVARMKKTGANGAYDLNASALENMDARGAEFKCEDLRDASFFAISFDQVVT